MFFALSLSAIGQTYSKDMEKRAKSGDAAAQRDLGICYLNGFGTNVDYKKAFEWLCQSALQDASAQYYLGIMFEDGKVDLTTDKKHYYNNLLRTLNDAEQQIAQSTPHVLWFIKSANGGNDLAMIKMARISRTNKDEQNAIKYFKLAADIGNSEGLKEYQTFIVNLAATTGVHVTSKDLIISSDVGTQEYTNDEHERIIILNTVSHIGYGAFEWGRAKEIIFQEGDNLLTIETAAFGFGNRHNDWPRDPKEIVFNRPVHIKAQAFNHCCPDLLVFNKDVDFIGEDAFGNDKGVKKVVFKKVPKNLHSSFIRKKDYKINCNIIEIPSGTESKFALLGIPDEKIYGQSGRAASFHIKLEKPNTILSVIPLDKLSSVDSLTITGFMYETDLKVLESCKNMRFLDLSKTYITYSPEKMKEIEANAQYLKSLFQFMGAAADAKYQDYQMSTLDHAYVKGFAKLMADGVITKADEGCLIPSRSMCNMAKLETLILPTRASKIEAHSFMNCGVLKTVKLPPYLKVIGTGGFYGCRNLRNIDFPKTLTTIGSGHIEGVLEGEGSFMSTGIKKFDFSKCTFTGNYSKSMWYFKLFQCQPEEIRLPSGIERVHIYARLNNTSMTLYIPASVKMIDVETNVPSTVHFASPTPPKYDTYKFESNSTFYIPKGSTTAYYAAFGNTYKYIEE